MRSLDLIIVQTVFEAMAFLGALLCWFTAGRVIPETSVVDKLVFKQPAKTDARPFSFRLPSAPYSFNGGLAMLGWAIELVALPMNESTRRMFDLSPTGGPVSLVLSESASLE